MTGQGQPETSEKHNQQHFTSTWDSRFEAPKSGSHVCAVHIDYNSTVDQGLKEYDDIMLFSFMDKTRKLPIVENMPSVVPALCSQNSPEKRKILLDSLTTILQEMETAQASYIKDLEPAIRDMIAGLSQARTIVNDKQWNASLECSRDISQLMENSLRAVVDTLDESVKSSCVADERRDSTASSQGTTDRTMTPMIKEGHITAETTPGPSPVSSPRFESIKTAKQKKACAHCGISDTPEWRRGPEGPRSVCNACGLFFGKLCKGYDEDVARFIMLERRSKGLCLERKVPQSIQFNGVNRSKGRR